MGAAGKENTWLQCSSMWGQLNCEQGNVWGQGLQRVGGGLSELYHPLSKNKGLGYPPWNLTSMQMRSAGITMPPFSKIAPGIWMEWGPCWQLLTKVVEN
jgi:hypothetical protein|mmetsp:Transcript_101673/g.172174  ORF Transcript_101673/g.172174 Transcript_101673/m.172174 type:complete len:99 (+) Transcript_101673:499-795(+)